jgi:hypothetical protein
VDRVWHTEVVQKEDLKVEIATDGVLETSVLHVTESDSEGSGDEGGCGIYIVITIQIYIKRRQQCNSRLRMHVCSPAMLLLRFKSSVHPRSARTVVCYPFQSDRRVPR